MEEIEFPTYSLSNSLIDKIRKQYREKFGIYPESDSSLPNAIHWTSDFYIENPTANSPWKKENFQKAYLAYFLPKNILRSMGVIDRLQDLGFFPSQKMSVLEWGSGNGAFDLALQQKKLDFSNYHFIEASLEAQKEHEVFAGSSHRTWSTQLPKSLKKFTHLVFSYSLTELDQLPDWVFEIDNIVILEPSTQQDARRLMKWRDDFLEQGYHIWAPCTHHQSCPLLTSSKKDWCHDNYSVEYPSYLLTWQEQIKMRFSNPATSYLAVSRSSVKHDGLVRVVGNTLKQRGKHKQMLCRGKEREFLSWFSKREDPVHIPRGSLIRLGSDVVKKSNELRVGNKFSYVTKKNDS